MFDPNKEWSISFAGCGFMGIYYVGVIGCILERFPRFIRDASKVYGASAGALMAAVITLGIPLDKCCTDLMHMAKEARKYKLGPLHPAYNLLQLVQQSLLEKLPEDAHLRVSGKLSLSLTRVSDGRNLLVSQFDSREELIQALICSCFVPLYCGVVPPTYRGVYYVDGAVSDNLPRCQLGRTITISPYAGESDLCPRASTLTFHEVSFNNVSIQVNSENLYRVTSTFFPPEAETMAEICQSGYMDALRFLQENNMISSESPLRSLQANATERVCCDQAKDPPAGEESAQRDHPWLDPKLIQNLPAELQRVLCKACRETHTAGGLLTHMTEYLPKKVASYLPFDSARSVAQRVRGWIPDVPRDMRWLFGVDASKQTLKEKLEREPRPPRLRRCSSLPSDLHLWDREEEVNLFPEGPEGAKPPPAEGRGWGLGRALGLLRSLGSEQTSDPK
ncbi:patatin-like phospholipase domain-containing protein 2 isoform X1 [Poeciliopsis prolifica]|uniref:patatin-like phospholipase domain-containing protein 2 isoform X1 n=2 Tax=Poeciliopsis prolifica TaxID=188132 RepID=UPI0024132D17|nr:patatin-like phospholipase domain-containing protein 2 isoform X1 [Poeciliopsis prolifica]